MDDRTIPTSLEDPRLEPYRNLKRTNLTRWSERFIAEGEKVVERLLASAFAVDSVLLSDRRRRFLERVPAGVATFVLTDSDCERLIGFEFHQGVLACGLRRPRRALCEIISRDGRVTVAVGPRMTDPDNLGTLLRLGGAFGIDAVVLGPGSADPLSRRTLRVSMGAALSVPVVECLSREEMLAELSSADLRLAATVLDADAEPLMAAGRPERLALLLGNEAHGLDPEDVAACERRITIPMSPGTDSLNVSAAATVFLYHFTRVV